MHACAKVQDGIERVTEAHKLYPYFVRVGWGWGIECCVSGPVIGRLTTKSDSNQQAVQQSGLERLGRKRERANKYQVPLCLAAPTYPHRLICEDCMISPSTSAPLYPFSSTAIFFFQFLRLQHREARELGGCIHPRTTRPLFTLYGGHPQHFLFLIYTVLWTQSAVCSVFWAATLVLFHS